LKIHQTLCYEEMFVSGKCLHEIVSVSILKSFYYFSDDLLSKRALQG